MDLDYILMLILYNASNVNQVKQWERKGEKSRLELHKWSLPKVNQVKQWENFIINC